jgi:CO/xanthine dehydrogenase Mo-binding subunit
MDTGRAYTIMRQIVGEELKVPLDSIKVEILDTAKVKDTGCAEQQHPSPGGSAYEAASRHARNFASRRAAMNASPDELILYDGGVTMAAPKGG